MGIQVVLPQPGYTKQRRWARYKVDVPVRVITDGPTKVAIVQGRGSELNCGGMTVFAGMELSMEAQVSVEFTPPYSGQPIRVRCFVRNRNGYTYGMEFITESDADYESVGQIAAILKGLGTRMD
jgi:PilZ domain